MGEGINAGSARACKARCRLEEACNFWTYKEGASRDLLTRDCFLKEGTPGLPVPREAVPRLGFVSGTRDNNCICIKSEDEEDEVCPIKDPRGLVYPWRSLDDELQGSYVAVAGTPGRGAVHVVEGVPALAGGSVTVVNGVRVCSKIFCSIIYHAFFISVSLSPWWIPCGCSTPSPSPFATGDFADLLRPIVCDCDVYNIFCWCS